MSNTRLTVVVRRDLQLVPGLLAAQVSHIVNEWIKDKVLCEKPFTQDEKDWLAEPYLSVLAVGCWEELNHIEVQARNACLPVWTWEDTIPMPTIEALFLKCKVGISIGPDDFDKIKIVTGMLPLY